MPTRALDPLDEELMLSTPDRRAEDFLDGARDEPLNFFREEEDN